MNSPLLNSPPGQCEERKSALPSRIEQQEEHLLEEFARLMGTDVSAVRFLEGSAGFAPGEASPLRAIALEQITKHQSDAGAASTEASPEAGDESLGTSSDSHRCDAYSNAPSLEGLAPEQDAIVAPRKSSRATLMLGTVFAIGIVGVIGVWAAVKIAPGVRGALVIDRAADDSSKGTPLSDDAASSGDHTFSILPAGQTSEPNPVGLASSVEHSPELQQPGKSPPAAATTAASPERSGDPIVLSSAPATRSVAPATDAASVPPTTADQTAAPAGASATLPDPTQVKAGVVSQGGSVADGDSASSTDAKPSPKVAEAPVSPQPSNTLPQPDHPPVPLPRPSFNSSTNGAPQTLAHKIAARPKSSSKSVDHAPNPAGGATTAASPSSLDLATAPGAATAPVVTKAWSETRSSTESWLNFVPNLFEKGVSAVRGFVGDTSHGG